MMTHTELKQAILDYIRELYEMEYIGGLEITDLDPVGYKISFNFDKSEMPLVIIADLPDEEFLPFIKEELRSRKLHRVKYFGATKLPPEPITVCNERKRTY
nr:MAG TPA: Putative transposase [Bacteriophage sp.]